jgi:DNA-binding XRE family transcriptional regulator
MLARKIRRGVLRKLRQACGLSQDAAAQRIGISVRALRAHESDEPPETMRAANLHAFAKLYKVKVDDLLEPVAPASLLRQTLTAPVRVPAAAGAPELEASINGGERAPGLPALSTLSQRAERERVLGLHEVEIETSVASVKMVYEGTSSCC